MSFAIVIDQGLFARFYHAPDGIEVRRTASTQIVRGQRVRASLPIAATVVVEGSIVARGRTPMNHPPGDLRGELASSTSTR